MQDIFVAISTYFGLVVSSYLEFLAKTAIYIHIWVFRPEIGGLKSQDWYMFSDGIGQKRYRISFQALPVCTLARLGEFESVFLLKTLIFAQK